MFCRESCGPKYGPPYLTFASTHLLAISWHGNSNKLALALTLSTLHIDNSQNMDYRELWATVIWKLKYLQRYLMRIFFPTLGSKVLTKFSLGKYRIEEVVAFFIQHMRHISSLIAIPAQSQQSVKLFRRIVFRFLGQ